MLVLALMPIATNIYGNYEYFPANFMVLSKVQLENNMVIINNQEIQISSIEKIELEINDWLGKKIVQNLRPYGAGPKLSRGVNNFLKIYPNNSTQISLRIQLVSNEQFMELGTWLKSLYKTNIEIIEKYDHSRSYGLRHLNYKEIQRFKEEYTT